MEESSDDNFAWSNASSDTIESDNMTSKKHNHECEWENESKKEIQDELFKNNKKQKKAKKRKYEECEEVYKPAKKRNIKSEPESDKDNTIDINEAESYLKLRVKEETLTSLDTDIESKPKKKKKHKKDKSLNETELISNRENNIELNTKPSDDLMEEKIYLNDKESKIDISCIKLEKNKKKKKAKRHSDREEISDNTKDDLSMVDVTANEPKNDVKFSNGVSFVSSTMLENQLDVTNNIKDLSNVPIQSSKKTCRLSDRLIFEDNEIINSAQNGFESDQEVLQSFEKVKIFLKSNSHLSSIKSFIPFDIQEEDVWVLKCPSEININDFKNVNLVLDGKSKLKVGGQIYDGHINNTESRLPIVTYSKNKSCLKYLPIVETITFHKRIPKPHLQDDAMVINNQTSFIPLPDTKYRHPIFGTNYKKAIKVSKSIRERISELNSQPVLSEKKKKHKKEKNKIESDSGLENNVCMKGEPESPIKTRKRKHKHIEEDVKPTKRIKLEQDPNAWESEKAIEKNLFNF